MIYDIKSYNTRSKQYKRARSPNKRRRSTDSRQNTTTGKLECRRPNSSPQDLDHHLSLHILHLEEVNSSKGEYKSTQQVPQKRELTDAKANKGQAIGFIVLRKCHTMQGWLQNSLK